MLNLEDFMNIRDLKQQGWSVSVIAEHLNLDRTTIDISGKPSCRRYRELSHFKNEMLVTNAFQEFFQFVIDRYRCFVIVVIGQSGEIPAAYAQSTGRSANWLQLAANWYRRRTISRI